MTAETPALTPPLASIVESLAAGPRRTDDLVKASGKGRGYVRLAIHKLNRRRCDIRRLGPQQSHHGAVYVAVSIPWIREVLCRPRCVRCDGYLARDHADTEILCSPCRLTLEMLEAS